METAAPEVESAMALDAIFSVSIDPAAKRETRFWPGRAGDRGVKGRHPVDNALRQQLEDFLIEATAHWKASNRWLVLGTFLSYNSAKRHIFWRLAVEA